MRATIDAVGRLVISKPLRVALGLGPGAELDVTLDGAGLRLRAERTYRSLDVPYELLADT